LSSSRKAYSTVTTLSNIVLRGKQRNTPNQGKFDVKKFKQVIRTTRTKSTMFHKRTTMPGMQEKEITGFWQTSRNLRSKNSDFHLKETMRAQMHQLAIRTE